MENGQHRQRCIETVRPSEAVKERWRTAVRAGGWPTPVRISTHSCKSSLLLVERLRQGESHETQTTCCIPHLLIVFDTRAECAQWSACVGAERAAKLGAHRGGHTPDSHGDFSAGGPLYPGTRSLISRLAS